MARTRVTHVIDLYAKVKADPRVQAAQAAKDNFYASEAGQVILMTGTLQELHRLPEDTRLMFEAHQQNYNSTFQTVKRELLIEAGVIQPEPAAAV